MKRQFVWWCSHIRTLKFAEVILCNPKREIASCKNIFASMPALVFLDISIIFLKFYILILFINHRAIIVGFWPQGVNSIYIHYNNNYGQIHVPLPVIMN